MNVTQLKREIVEDLNYQLVHKGKPYTAVSWYLNNPFYDAKPVIVERAIRALVKEGAVTREPLPTPDGPLESLVLMF